MRIQHNIMAMNAYRNYSNNTSALSKNLERLSSGYKINRAGDDAAGLAISEKMRAQITGLEAAQKNVKDGISLVNTAEGAMQEIQDMLNRMVSLATQSSNGTYDNEVDRKNLQAEVDQLREEINRIADSANFNGINLLDGSLAESAAMSSPTEQSFTIAGSTSPGVGELPAVDNSKEVGFASITHNQPGLEHGTTFTVNLNNTTFENTSADELGLSLTRGGKEVLSITMTGGVNGTGGMDAATIAKTIADALTSAEKESDLTSAGFTLKGDYGFDDDGNLTIEGQAFKVEADGTALKFTQIAAPKTTADEFDGRMTVSMTGVGTTASSSGGGSGSTASGALSGVALRSAIEDGSSNTIGAVDFAGLDQSAVAAAIDAWNNDSANSSAQIGDGDSLTVKYDTATSQFQLLAGTNVIATSDDDLSTLLSDGDTATIKFTDATDGNSIGSIEITQVGGTAPATTDLTTAVDTGYTYIAVGSVKTQPSSPEIKYTEADYNAGDGQKFDIDFTGVTVDDDANTTMVVGFAGREYEITLTSDDTDSSGGGYTASELIATALKNAIDAANTAAQKELDDAAADGRDPDADIMSKALYDVGTKVFYNVTDNSDGTLTIEADTPSDIQDENLLALTDTNKPGKFTITTKTSSNTTSTPSGDVMPSGRDYNAQTESSNASAEGLARLASTYFSLTDDMVQEGATLRIGEETYTFTANATGANDIDISSGDLDKIGSLLTQKSPANGIYSIGYEAGRVTVTEKEEYGALDAKDKPYALDTIESIADSLGFTAASEKLSDVELRGGLTLQIGDTSAKYNQLTVHIGDMHTTALGIADLDISSPEGAQAAIDTIKNAINYVSSVRGTLGATSNRLDHTANNLSVMTENITDAESTIRDTDIAEEMMAYTKNNILVQSAQAMLAQANQVPQGVLQLLQ